LSWLDNNLGGDVHRILFWKLDRMFLCRIKRDGAFWSEVFVQLKDVWDLIVKYREDEELFKREIGAAAAAATNNNGVTSSSASRNMKSRSSKRALEDAMESLRTSYGFTQA
jgi:hypothetical protein